MNVTTLAGSAGKFGSTDGDGATARFTYPQGAHDLSVLVPSEAVDRITKTVAARGHELAKYPRSNVRETPFSVEWIYEREEERE